MVKWPFFGELNVSTFKSRQPLYPQWFEPWSRLAISAPILSKEKKFSSETFAQFHIFYPYSPTPLCFCLVMRYFLETSGAGWHVSRKLDQKITPQMSLFVPIAAPGFILVHASLISLNEAKTLYLILNLEHKLLLSSTWHFHSCLLTTQAKGWAHFYEKPVNAASTKNHKKKSFLFPESNVAEASVSKVSTFTIINKILQCDHRDIHFAACSYKVVFICPVFWLSEI